MHRDWKLPLALAIAAVAVLAGASLGSAGPQATEAAARCNPSEKTQGVSSSEIKLGWIGPLSGPVAPPGQGALDGQNYYFDQINKAGGIKGRKIKLVPADDAYNPPQAQQAVRRLWEREKVFAIAGGIGTPNYVVLGSYLKQKHIIVIGPYAPARDVGTLKFPTTYMTWTNFIQEFYVIADHLAKKGFKKFAMLYQTGDVGNDAIAGAEAALARHKIKLIKKVPTESTTTDYSSIAQELKNTGAQVVLTIVQPTGTGQAIQAMRKIGYSPQFGSQSDMTDSSFREAFGKDVDGLIAATKVAGGGQWDTVKDPLVKRFVAQWKRGHKGKEPSGWNAVGYSAAQVTVRALQTAKAPTPSCLEEALQKMKKFRTGIIPPVTFGPNKRQGVLAVGLAQIKGKRLVQVQPFTEIKGSIG